MFAGDVDLGNCVKPSTGIKNVKRTLVHKKLSDQASAVSEMNIKNLQLYWPTEDNIYAGSLKYEQQHLSGDNVLPWKLTTNT